MLRDKVRGPQCPLTGRTVAEELLHAVSLLGVGTVGDRDGVRYSHEEFRAYADGWYRGISSAIACMNLALERRRLRLGVSREKSECPTPTNRRTRDRSAPIASPRSNARAVLSSADQHQRRAIRKRSASAIE